MIWCFLFVLIISDLFSAPQEFSSAPFSDADGEGRLLGDYFKGKVNLLRNVHVMTERILEWLAIQPFWKSFEIESICFKAKKSYAPPN